MEWEQIDDQHQRVKVFGGWLVKAFEDVYHDKSDCGSGMQDGWDWRVAMAFVPDPNNEWVIGENEVETPELITGVNDCLANLTINAHT